jgi:putative membrane protein
MPSSSELAFFNACLNASALVCLCLGYIAIRRQQILVHRLFMGTAFVLSAFFVVSYVTRYTTYGDTAFQGQGIIRPVYFTILVSHVLLAIVVVPLVLRTLYFALRSDFVRHRKIARITFPIWAYVSLTGVVVYLMLYQWFA